MLITFSVYLKIVRWWVKEVEATTDPDFDQGKYDSTNWDEVESIDTVFLREIILKSLVSDEIEKLGILCYKTRGPKSTTAAVRAI